MVKRNFVLLKAHEHKGVEYAPGDVLTDLTADQIERLTAAGVGKVQKARGEAAGEAASPDISE